MSRSRNSSIADARPLALAGPSGMGTGTMVIDAEDEPRLSEYRDILVDHKWLIAGVLALSLLCGLVYVTLATPIYGAGLLLQIDDTNPDSKSALAEASGLFEVKTPATGEIQVITSNMVLNAAAQQTDLQVDARPRYLPLAGAWLARHAKALSDPGLLGFGGWVSGTERIEATRFEVPEALEDTKPFVVTAEGGGRYTVRHELLDAPLEGMVGQPLRKTLPEGDIRIELKRLDGKPGAEFSVAVASRFRAVERLRSRLQVGEQGRQSNVIGVGLQDSDRQRLVRTLNAIGEQYVQQNMARRSAEAEKTLAFLDSQLPVFERQLLASEDAYAKFRNKNGTVDFGTEAKVWLEKTSDLEKRLLDLQQRRREADINFTEQNPRVQVMNQQIAAVQGELSALNARIAGMPNLQRDALRLERSVRVNSTLYQSMQNNAMQMRLVKEGKMGNVRLLDKAVLPKDPVKPHKSLVLAFALVLGGLLGPALAIVHARTRGGIRNPAEIEDHTGLDVYAVVPRSPEQGRLDSGGGTPASGALLADAHPRSHAVEALRSLRVGLKPALAGAPNNRILITGATPGIGKSFVASNFATLLAQSGRRVLLIYADLRKNDLHKSLGLRHESGLCEVLAGQIGADQAIHREVRTRLDVLAAGKLPDMPTDILESDEFSALLESLSARYEYIVIDTAPVLVAADAAAVAPACGVVLLVARAEQTQLGELTESIRRLTQAGARIDGVLLNGMNFTRRYNGSQGYRYGSYRYADYPLAGAR